ncbi:MAG: tetratricopeptide repeat protein, partial [Cyclobacteriaceae bacterium]
MRTIYFCLILSLLFVRCSPHEEAPEPSPNQSLHFVDDVNAHFYKSFSQDFRKTKNDLKKAVEISSLNQWPDKEALTQKNYAVVLYMLGEYEQALMAIQRSFDLYDSLQDESGQVRALNEMGNFLRKQGQNEDAIKAWKKAETLSKAIDDQEALGTTYGMMGTFYWLQKDYEKSDHYYFKCYQIRMEQKDSIGLGYVLIDLADMAHRKGDLTSALNYFKESNSIREAIGDLQGIVDNYKMMGDLFMKEESPAKAIPYYHQCATESENLGYPDLVRKSFDSLSSAYAQLNQFEIAYQYQKEADQLEDSLFNADRAKKLAELQTQYETEKKEKQIAVQQAEIANHLAKNQRNLAAIACLIIALVFLLIIAHLIKSRSDKKHALLLQQAQTRTKEAQLEAALNSQETERKRFARDLHDGFGQMISVLNLNLKALEKGTSSKEDVFENSSKVLDDMYKELKGICFNLMPETLIKSGVV